MAQKSFVIRNRIPGVPRHRRIPVGAEKISRREFETAPHLLAFYYTIAEDTVIAVAADILVIYTDEFDATSIAVYHTKEDEPA